MTVSDVALVVISILLTAAIGAGGWAVKRQIQRNDAFSLTLAAHTVTLAEITSAVTALTTAATSRIDDVEELDDAVQAMQIATALLRHRLDEHDRFKAALEGHKPEAGR